MGKLNNIDKAAAGKGSGINTLWQFVKFIVVSLGACIVQVASLAILYNIPAIKALSVIVTDSEGRMLDALQDSVAGHLGLLEDGCFSAWKALAPYITEEMGQNAIFEVTGYKIP